MRSGTRTRTSEDGEFQDFFGRGRPGRVPGRGRGRQFSEISGTSEDEDGGNVDVLRRPCLYTILSLII